MHLITITIGLVIALGLEGAVEWWHHRNVVHEAEAHIREEFESNQRLVPVNVSSVRADEKRIAADIKQLLSLREGQKIQHGNLEYTVSWSSFSESAWKAAQSSGALVYINLRTAQDLEGVYTQQEFVATTAERIYENQTRAIAPLFITGDPNAMSRDEIQTTLERSADLLLGLRSLEQLLSELNKQYTEELKKL